MPSGACGTGVAMVAVAVADETGTVVVVDWFPPHAASRKTIESALDFMAGLITQRLVRRARWLVWTFAFACRSDPPAPLRVDAPMEAEAAVDARADVDAIAEASPAREGMLFVPSGTFTMGADRGGEEDEHPAHRVTLDGFWLDKTPVTNAAYEQCVVAKACRRVDPLIATHAPAFSAPHHPVVGVSWDDAHAYCAWTNRRLPSEAEYERAMRGDDERPYAWGSELPSPKLTTFGRTLDAGTTDDVGTHPLGRGPFGHDDLAGNVWEWCEDEYDPVAYTRATAERGIPGTCDEIMATQNDLRAHDRQGFTGSNPIPFSCDRVLRGGAFNYDGEGLRATNRVHHPAHFRLLMAGFRCALTK